MLSFFFKNRKARAEAAKTAAAPTATTTTPATTTEAAPGSSEPTAEATPQAAAESAPAATGSQRVLILDRADEQQTGVHVPPGAVDTGNRTIFDEVSMV